VGAGVKPSKQTKTNKSKGKKKKKKNIPASTAMDKKSIIIIYLSCFQEQNTPGFNLGRKL
jgi:hypothetical protein